jgi:NADPH:quinone reductase-like Zn-dependent oxidoreductase
MVVAGRAFGPARAVLVQAGASGVGGAALPRPPPRRCSFTTVGSPDKAAAARRLGASEVILYRDVDFAAEVRRLTRKRGVDVVLDHIGLETWEGNIRSLARGGRLVLCGATSGHEAPTNLRQLFFKNLSFLGSTMGAKRNCGTFDLVQQQRLEPVVDEVLPP